MLRCLARLVSRPGCGGVEWRVELVELQRRDEEPGQRAAELRVRRWSAHMSRMVAASA